MYYNIHIKNQKVIIYDTRNRPNSFLLPAKDLEALFDGFPDISSPEFWNLLPNLQAPPFATLDGARVEARHFPLPEESSPQGSSTEPAPPEEQPLPSLFQDIDMVSDVGQRGSKRPREETPAVQTDEKTAQLFRDIQEERDRIRIKQQELEHDLQEMKAHLIASEEENRKLKDQILKLTAPKVDVRETASSEEAKYNTDPVRYPLHHAAAEMKYRCRDISKLLQLHDIDQQDLAGNTPLHVALIQKRDFAIIKQMLAGKSDVTIANNEGNTPLHLAVLADNLEAVRQLRFLGADTSAMNFYDHIPMHYAKSRSMQLALK